MKKRKHIFLEFFLLFYPLWLFLHFHPQNSCKKKTKMQKKGQKRMFNLKIYAKKRKNTFSISKFIKKKAKMDVQFENSCKKGPSEKKADSFQICFFLYLPIFAFSTSKFMQKKTKMQQKKRQK